MNLITIPCDIQKINPDDKIDMSVLNINVDQDQKKRYAFIYLRNVGIKNELSFDKCSYNDKEEFLKGFLSMNINIDIPILASTWISVLMYNAGLLNPDVNMYSILSMDEIKLFNETNIDFINKVRRLINSLTLYAVVKYNSGIQICDTSNIEYTDDTEIKLTNLYQLAMYPAFTFITEPMPPKERSLVYYTKLFDDVECSYSMMKLRKLIPMFELLSMLTAPNEMKSVFAAKINEEE